MRSAHPIRGHYCGAMGAAKRSFLVVLAAVSLAMGGCAALPVAGGPPSTQAPTAEETEAPLSEEVSIETQWSQARSKACVPFKKLYLDWVPKWNAGGDGQLAALKSFAYGLGELAPKVGDTGEDQLNARIAGLAAQAASLADEIDATGEISTTGWLGFRTAVQAVAEPCNFDVSFAD